jgi:heme/copper-type cytochrome/quinol oxidase subunit 3
MTAVTTSSPAGIVAAQPDGPLALPSGEARVTASPPAIPGATVMGMALILAADLMLLGTLLAAFFALKGGAASWPPRGVKLDIYLPMVVTITAVMSAVSMGWAVFAVRRHDVGNAIAAMVLTVVFGLAMANLQWYSMVKAPFGVARHSYGTMYDLLLNYHLAHILIGIVMIVVVGCRTLAGHFGRERNEPVRAVAMFWQYGNVAWALIVIALFFLSKAHA